MSEEKTVADVEVQVNELWNNFSKGFWGLFVARLLFYGMANSGTGLPVVGFIGQLIVTAIMVWLVGKSVYKLTGRKRDWLYGFFGLFWFGIVGIFLAYFVVKWKYYNAIGKKFATREKVVMGALIVLGLLFVLIFGQIAFSSFSFLSDSKQSATQEWATVTSPDGKLSVELPRNPQYVRDDPPNTIDGYSYAASGDDHIQYIVKYENYSSVVKSTGVDLRNATLAAKQTFLKDLVDSTVDSFNLNNFVSEYDSYKEYPADNFSGTITKGSESANVKGIIILVDESVYYVITLADAGHEADFDRVLNSLQIKLGL